MKTLTTAAVRVLVLCLATLGVPSIAPAATIQAHARIGNNVDGMVWVPSDSGSGRWVLIDGYEAISAERGSPVLFSLAGKVPSAPKGICYDASRDRYYFTTTPILTASSPYVDRLSVSDGSGNVLASLGLRYLSTTDPATIVQFEGCVVIPGRQFPDRRPRLAIVTIHLPDLVAHVQVARLDGVVEREIVPGGPLAGAYITGIAYQGGLLYLSPVNSQVFSLALVGEAVSGPVAEVATIRNGDALFGRGLWFEGLAFNPGGALAASDFEGNVYLFDASLRRTPQLDRSIRREPRADNATSISFNADLGELVLGNALLPAVSSSGIVRVSTTLGEIKLLVDPLQSPVAGGVPGPFNGVAWLPGENLVAVALCCSDALRGVAFFDGTTGAYVSRLHFSGPSFPRDSWRPRAVAPLPGGNLAISVRGTANANVIQVVTRSGSSDPDDPLSVIPNVSGQITLATAPVGALGLAFFDDGAGGELIAGGNFYGLDGHLIRVVDPQSVGLAAVNATTPITSGPLAGSFALLSASESAITIALLP